MNTENITKFVGITFSKVEATKLKPLTSKKGWEEQFKALINIVPWIGGVISQEFQIYQNYRDSEFFRKYTTYILSVASTSEEKRNKFAEEIVQKANDSAGNVIAGMVDRLDNINKENILAKLTIARIEDKISIETFFRLSSVLERIPYVDLAKLQYYQVPFYDEDGDTELLNSTGVLRSVKFSSDGDTYILSPLGVKLLTFGLGVDAKVADVKGTSVSLNWEEISDDSDVVVRES